MKKNIYIQLLNEGTEVYRPVPAIKIKNNIYKLQGFDIYNPEDEIWEFSPGTYVQVEKRNLDGENVLIAIQKLSLE